MQGRVLELEYAAICASKERQQLLHQQLEGTSSVTASQTPLNPNAVATAAAGPATAAIVIIGAAVINFWALSLTLVLSKRPAVRGSG
jgi:hypothetical protein